MTHQIIITENGEGAGGKSVSTATWTPSHDLTAGEQMRRVNKATRLLDKVNDALYGPDTQDNE